MGGGEFADFIVDQAGGFAGGPYVGFADVGLAFWIDDPDGAGLSNGTSDQAETLQVEESFGGEKDEVGVRNDFAARIVRNTLGEIFQEFRFFDAQHGNALSGFHAELIDQQPVRIIALRLAPFLGLYFRTGCRHGYILFGLARAGKASGYS